MLPFYDYKCNKCGDKITIKRGINETNSALECKTCKAEMSRVYSNVGVSFNGQGFYSTDKR